jgi:hypothetical protein
MHYAIYDILATTTGDKETRGNRRVFCYKRRYAGHIFFRNVGFFKLEGRRTNIEKDGDIKPTSAVIQFRVFNFIYFKVLKLLVV